LREERDKEYAELLERQKLERAELREWQSDGQRAYWLLDTFYPVPSRGSDADVSERSEGDNELTDGFRASAREVTDRTADEHPERPAREFAEEEVTFCEESAPGRTKGLGDIGLGIAGALGVIGERLFDAFFGGGETKMGDDKRNEPEPSKQQTARRVAEEQTRATANSEEEAKLLAYWRERRERKRERD
jgi:hypothetical protein